MENDPEQPLLNRPLVSLQPPGSTFKLVTSAAALAAGYEPSTELPGPAEYPLRVPARRSPTPGESACGADNTVTLERSLAISCNTSFAYLGNQLGNDALNAQAEKFGFNSSFDIPLTAATSRYPDRTGQGADRPERHRPVQRCQHQPADGHGGASIANRGVTMRPYLVADTRSSDLQVLSTTAPEEFATAMTPTNATKLLGMMESVVNQGTGSPPRSPASAWAARPGPPRPATAARMCPGSWAWHPGRP